MADRRGSRAVAKTAWLAVVGFTVWLATRGLAAGFLEFDPVRNLRAARHAEALLTVSGLLFLALAAVAWLAFSGPLWSVLVFGGVAMGCFLMTSTELRFAAIPVLWLASSAAAVGVIFGSPRRTDVADEQVS